MSVERVYVAVDINNLWHSCRETYGIAARVSFARLREMILRGQTAGTPRQLTLVAYAVALPKYENSSFLKSLEASGYRVKIRRMRIAKGIQKPFHTDWDVGITIDAINLVNDYDTFVLASGDGDYAPLLQELRARKKRTEVVTIKNSASGQLFSAADVVLFLTEQEIFHDPKISRGHNADGS